MIRILLFDIKNSGLDIEQTIPKEGIGLSDEEIDLRSPIEVKAHLERQGDVVTADTVIKVDFGFLCGRCLEDMHEVQTRSYHFDFELEPGMQYVDVGEEIRQMLIMDNPARVLCKTECKGMCAKCGANLNEEPCKCK